MDSGHSINWEHEADRLAAIIGDGEFAVADLRGGEIQIGLLGPQVVYEYEGRKIIGILTEERKDVIEWIVDNPKPKRIRRRDQKEQLLFDEPALLR